MFQRPIHGLAILTLLTAVAWVSPSDVQETAESSAFEALHGATVWPVAGTGFDDIVSTFGPRIKASTGRYDWHRGIDIDSPRGRAVVAASSGVLWKVTSYASGGTTVILRHRYPVSPQFHDRELRYFYTFYMHLDSVESHLALASARGERPPVTAGEQIGTVGHSGAAIGDHLHFEVRVGTPCSLEYQLRNPASSCAGYGFDPHVHPLALFAPVDDWILLRAFDGRVTGQHSRVLVRMSDDQPMVNRVELEIADDATGQVLSSLVLDLNMRLGFDATTNALLDTVDRSKPYFVPVPAGTTHPRVYLVIVIVPTATFEGIGGDVTATLTVYDIWGRSRSIEV